MSSDTLLSVAASAATVSLKVTVHVPAESSPRNAREDSVQVKLLAPADAPVDVSSISDLVLLGPVSATERLLRFFVLIENVTFTSSTAIFCPIVKENDVPPVAIALPEADADTLCSLAEVAGVALK